MPVLLIIFNILLLLYLALSVYMITYVIKEENIMPISLIIFIVFVAAVYLFIEWM